MLWKTQFYHVSYIFLHFLSFQTNISSTPTKSKFIKTQILNTQQKKFHQIRDQFGSENNKTRTTHATRGGLTQSKQIGDSAGRSWVWRMVRLGFATIGDEWVWWWTSSTIWGMGSTDEIDDLRNGFDGRARRSEKWVRDLTIWALLDERARSWVFWVRRSSWMWINLAFAGAGAISLQCCLSLSLLFSWGGSDLKWKWERKLFSAPLHLILRSNWNHFQFDRIFSNSQTFPFPKNHFWNQFEVDSNAALMIAIEK